MKADRIALIDGDIIAYRCCTAGQQTYDWGDTGGKVVDTVSFAAASEAALRMTEDWAEKADCKTIAVAFTSGDNFRRRILPTYKATRGKKPEAHGPVVEAMKKEFKSFEIAGLEADDVMGILATTDKYLDRAVVVTIDKDLQTIPGVHLNPTKEKRPHRVEINQADWFWLYQTLCGDSVDCYTGLPGCGPKGAGMILGGSTNPSKLEILWPRVLAAYLAKGHTEAFALTQARVARILRRSDYSKETKEVRLWNGMNKDKTIRRVSMLSLRKVDTVSACPVSIPTT